jgi:hypothetical protein
MLSADVIMVILAARMDNKQKKYSTQLKHVSSMDVQLYTNCMKLSIYEYFTNCRIDTLLSFLCFLSTLTLHIQANFIHEIHFHPFRFSLLSNPYVGNNHNFTSYVRM